MLFNSISFAIFLPIVFILHWFLANKTKTAQNIILLIASYYFYACWDWRFLFLLIFSITLDYTTGIMIEKATVKTKKRFWFWLSVLVNLGFLGVFKYYNFFAESFAEAISHFGFHADPGMLNVILPVGISFYTFHGLSYVIDIYNGRITAERNFIDYSLFVSFFPLLVAGPIERATHLLPQLKQKRTFDYERAKDGMRQILWGLFKKIVIADTCAVYVSTIFDGGNSFSGSTHVVGAIFFAFQIYCDFSGYSDIALGTARLFGVDLLRNFAYPYFSRDIAEFWRRWHISLSSWFRDYLYIPLGGSKVGTAKKVRNTLIIFLVSGFWHGANWTFIVWGLLNAIYIMPSILFKTNRQNLDIVAKGKILPSFQDLLKMTFTFALTVFAWIFFRSETVGDAITYLSKIFSTSLFSIPEIRPSLMLLLLSLFMIVEWLGREKLYPLKDFALKLPWPVRWATYYILVALICYNAGGEQQFIYFQF